MSTIKSNRMLILADPSNTLSMEAPFHSIETTNTSTYPTTQNTQIILSNNQTMLSHIIEITQENLKTPKLSREFMSNTPSLNFIDM